MSTSVVQRTTTLETPVVEPTGITGAHERAQTEGTLLRQVTYTSTPNLVYRVLWVIGAVALIWFGYQILGSTTAGGGGSFPFITILIIVVLALIAWSLFKKIVIPSLVYILLICLLVYWAFGYFLTQDTKDTFAANFNRVVANIGNSTPKHSDLPVATITIDDVQLMLDQRSDGGLETTPFIIGATPTTIPIRNQQCIHIGMNGRKTKLIGTDGAYNDSFEAYYVSVTGKPTKITVIYYPFSHKRCAHLRA